jgi:sodium transport system ATP-binding protein
MLYTLMRADSGRVLIDGIDVQSSRRLHARSSACCPMQRGIYKRLSARENIAYFGACTVSPSA